MGVTKKTTSKKTTKKATAAQLAALKKGREKLAKQRQTDKKKVREALKSTAKKIKKRTSKIMTTAKKRATKAATSEIQKTRKKLRKKGLVGCSSKKKTLKGDSYYQVECFVNVYEDQNSGKLYADSKELYDSYEKAKAAKNSKHVIGNMKFLGTEPFIFDVEED